MADWRNWAGDQVCRPRELVPDLICPCPDCVIIWNAVRAPQVVNGASDLFVEIFGEAGRHSRTALGVSALPYDVAAEVDAVVEVR